MTKKTKPTILDAGEYEPKATLNADLSDKQAVEEQTTQALTTQNSTEEYLLVLKERYASVTIKDIHDEDGYRNAKEAKKVLQTTRTTTEKICKVGREEALKIQKEWIAKEKSITGVIAELEDPITIRIKEIDTEIENIHKEEEAAKKLPFRVETIRKTLGEEFIINEEIVKALSDLEFSEYIVNERTLAVERKERAIKDAEEKAAQDKRDEEIRTQALAEQGKEHKRQLLRAIGMTVYSETGMYTCFIGNKAVTGPTDETLQLMDDSSLQLTVKSLSEQITQAREEKATADAATAAQKMFDDAEKERLENADKERLAIAKAQAATPDKQKLLQFADFLTAGITYPIVSSPEAQAVVDRAVFCVKAMQDDLMARINILK